MLLPEIQFHRRDPILEIFLTLYSNVIELCSMVFVFAPSDTCCDNCAVSDINISSSGFCIAMKILD